MIFEWGNELITKKQVKENGGEVKCRKRHADSSKRIHEIVETDKRENGPSRWMLLLFYDVDFGFHHNCIKISIIELVSSITNLEESRKSMLKNLLQIFL